MAEIKGLDKLQKRISNIEDAMKHKDKIIRDACLMVENSAKDKCPVGTGELRRSITSEVKDGVGYVGTNLYYAPYVEYGTGIYAKNGDGRDGYWVFVKGQEGEAMKERKTYTLEEAKRIMAILRSKGLEAYYTNGQQPQPFLYPAYDENIDEINKMFDDYIKEVLRNA